MPARIVVTAALAAILFGVGSSAARATEVTSSELRALAQRAVSDPAELARLKEVNEVDGRPVDMAAALTGDPSEVAARLNALAAGPEAPIADTARAGDEAGRILAQDRFQSPPIPRPFKGLLEWLHDLFEPVTDRLAQAFDWVAERIPGGRSALWIILGVIVVGLAMIAAARLSARRARAVTPTAGRPGAPVQDPDMLERAADEAEANGDHTAAVRLRFRAGLVRLQRAHAIELTDSTTTGQALAQLHRSTFDGLAASFEQIVYGSRAAAPSDVEESRRGWSQLFGEIGAHP